MYFLTNGLLLNPRKTQSIFIGNRQLLPKISSDTFINCDGVHIYASTRVKNLGVYFDNVTAWLIGVLRRPRPEKQREVSGNSKVLPTPAAS